jgi:DNA-binding MarR family transcriptional regulator
VSYRLIEHRLREVGVSPAQFRALSLVKLTDSPLTAGVLAMRLALDARTASDLIGRMETIGWVRRVRDLPDRRAARLELTEEGESVLARAWSPNVQAVEEAWQSVTEEQLMHIIDVMVLVRDNCLERLGYSPSEIFTLGPQSPASAATT